MIRPTTTRTRTTRRDALLGALAVAAAGATARPATPAASLRTAAGSSAAQLAEALLVHLRLRSDVATGRALQWYRGSVWGKRPFERAVRLFAVEGVSVNTLKILDGGGLEIGVDECGFWLDPDGGQPADRWINPLNGLACEPRHYRSVYATRFEADGRIQDRGSSWQARGGIEAPLRAGPWVWSSESVAASRRSAESPAPPDPLQAPVPVETATSLATFSARSVDLRRPLDGWLDSTAHFQSAGNFRPWMRMGQEPGVFSFQNSGCKLRGRDELPATLRGWIAARRADFLEVL